MTPTPTPSLVKISLKQFFVCLYNNNINNNNNNNNINNNLNHKNYNFLPCDWFKNVL